jgi:WD40 repeat protein/beta-lactamase regulating signal transducer with metallopeptidase domain
VGSLVEIGLANALFAGVLALAALLAGRYSRRPALVHALWVLVLIKLVTPPLWVKVPWMQSAQANTPRTVVPASPAPEPVNDNTAVAVADQSPLPTPAGEQPPAMRIEELSKGRPDMPAEAQMPMPEMPVAAGPAEREVSGQKSRVENQQPKIESEKSEQKSPPVATVAAETTEENEAPSGSRMAEVSGPSWPRLIQLLGCIWLGGALLFYLRVAWQLISFHHLLRHAKEAPTSLQQEAERLASEMGLKHCPQVWLVPGPVPPLLWVAGVRTRMYFPASLLGHLDEAGRSALLVHELAHLVRRDHWVRWVELIVAGLYWWYPLVWLACRRLQAAEEECCDAWVVTTLPGYGAAYAGALMETVDFLSHRPSPLPPVASGFGRIHHLKQRLALIIHGSTPRSLSLAGKFLVVLLLLAPPLIPTRGRQVAPSSPEESNEETKPVRSRVRQNTGAASGVVAIAATEGPLVPDEPITFLGNPRNVQGSGGQVRVVAVSPDGKTLAWGAGGGGNRVEGALTLWDLAGNREIATLVEQQPIRGLAFSPDSKILATTSFGSLAHLRDPATGKIRTILKGHKRSVNSVAWTPNSQTVLTASLDGKVIVWNAADGTIAKTITAHEKGVQALAISRDGKTLATVGSDTTAKVWDLPDGKLRHALAGHQSVLAGVAIGPDNTTVATTGANPEVRLWDGSTGKLKHKLNGHQSNVEAVAFLPTGDKLVTGSQDRTLRVWDVNTGEALTNINAHENRIDGLAVTPDGKSIISGGWDLVVKVWDAETYEEQRTLRARMYAPESNYPVSSVACSPDGKTLAVAGEERAIKLIDARTGTTRTVLEGHEDVVGRVAFSPDGKTLASAGFDGNVILWNVETGKRLATLSGHENWVFAVTFAPNGQTLATAGYDKTVRFWDVMSGKQLATLGKHKSGVRAVAFSADGRRLACGGADRAVRVFDLATRDEIAVLKGHDDAIRTVAFAPDGKTIASGGEDNTVRAWDIVEGKQLALHRHGDVVREVVYSPGGRSLASVSQDRSLRILDPKSLVPRHTFNVHTDAVTSVCFGPGARLVYTGSADRTIREWQSAGEAHRPFATFPGPGKQMWFASYSPDGRWLATGGDDALLTVRDAEIGRLLGSLDAVSSTVYGMAVSPDGKTLAMGCQDMTVKLWDTASRKLVANLSGHSFRVWAVAFSPDGKRLVSAAGSWQQASEPGEVKVWDLSTNKELLALAGHEAPVQTVAWSSNGKFIATGTRDAVARIFDASTGKELYSLHSHKDGVRSLVFDPESKYLATGSIDGTVRIWEVATGKELSELKASAAGVNCVAWSPDGKTLAAASKPAESPQPGEVRLWSCEVRPAGNAFKEKAVLKGHTSSVLAVRFSPDGKMLVSAGGTYAEFGDVIVWDVATQKQVLGLNGHKQWVEALAFSKDGKTLYSAGGTSDSRGEVRIWQVGGQSWQVKGAHKGSVCCAAWSPDSKTLATGSYDRTIKLWDAATGKVRATLAGHSGDVRALAFRPDGKLLASSSMDRTVKLWDLESNAERAELTRHQKLVASITWSPDGKLLATASADPFWREQTGQIKVYEVDKGKELSGADWENSPAMSIVFSPDGKMLLSGSPAQNSLTLWNVDTRKRVRTIEGASSIRVITYSPDEKLLATSHGPDSARGNGSIQVWDTSTWKERTALVGHNVMCLGIGFARDGKTLGSASVDGTVKLFDLTASPRPAVTARAGKPGREVGQKAIEQISE